MKKRVFALLLAVLMVAGTLPVLAIGSFAAPAAEATGMTFDNNTIWKSAQNLTAMPNTFEVWLNVPTDIGSGRLGGIYSNYNGGSDDFAFDVRNDGHPYLWYYNTDGKNVKINFTDVDVRQGKFIHLVIVTDIANGAMHC